MQAAAVLMPILLILDLVAVWTYRKSFDKITLIITIPSSIIGIIIGAVLVSQVNPDWIRVIIGFIAISFTISHWRTAKDRGSKGHSIFRGTVWGSITGFTSFVTLTGAPPYQMYLLPLKLEQRTYAGTFMIFFWMNNILKIIPFMMLGEMTRSTVTTSMILFPISLIFTFLGIWIVRKLPTKIFYEIIYILLFLVSIKLIYDGFTNIIV